MAFTVTARHTGTSGTSSVQTLATSSVTPTASSLLLVFASAQPDNANVAATWQTPTGGGWTYTNIATSLQYDWETTSNYKITSTLWQAAVGASPAAHTVTVDSWSTTQLGTYAAVSCDVTGHNTTTPVVQSKTNGANVNPTSNTASGSITFDTALTVGNLVVVGFGAGNDVASSFTSPTLGGQAMTQLFNITNNYTHAGLWYRVVTGAESNSTVTCTDMGDTVGNWAGVAVEVAAAGGGGSNFTQTPTDNMGLSDGNVVRLFGVDLIDPLDLTDSTVLENGKTQSPADNLGLTDSIALSLGRTSADTLGATDSTALVFARAVASADALGLTDSTVFVLNFAQTPTDALGLSDAAQVSLSGAGSVSPTDALGLTDAPALDQAHVYTDSAALSDATATTQAKAVADSLGLTDSAQVSLAGSGTVNSTDALDLTDQTTIDQAHLVADSLGLSDQALVTKILNPADSESLTDSVTFTFGLGRTDTTTVTDTVSASGSVSTVDSTGLTDTATVLLATVRSIIDNADLTDTAQPVLNPVADVTPRPFTGNTPRPYTGTTVRP